MDQDQDKLTDRMVSQLSYAGGAMRPQPGSRPDGGMLASTQDLLGQILETERQLRRDLEETREQLATEREARQHLEGVIRQIADVVVNGRKAKGT